MNTTTNSQTIEQPNLPLNLEELDGRLKRLRLPTMRSLAISLADRAAQEHWSHLRFLNELTIAETDRRTENRISKHLKKSDLERNKTWSLIKWSRFPMVVQHRMQQLQSGEFVKRAENLLMFGRPGSGKTLLLNALGEQLIRQGHTVIFAPCAQLVQHLLLAKRELRLPNFLSKLGRFSTLIIDDIGYVQQSREEMEVLFTLIADRYERTSIMISSNLPFSKWERIFKDPMTTAAAIDRLVHHSTIIELNVGSCRLEEAQAKQKAQAVLESQTPPAAEEEFPQN